MRACVRSLKIEEARGVCMDRRWKEVISAYPNGKQAWCYCMYVKQILTNAVAQNTLPWCRAEILGNSIGQYFFCLALPRWTDTLMRVNTVTCIIFSTSEITLSLTWQRIFTLKCTQYDIIYYNCLSFVHSCSCVTGTSSILFNHLFKWRHTKVSES
jgi:hypothetical protein